jgi:hypothetical protein
MCFITIANFGGRLSNYVLIDYFLGGTNTNYGWIVKKDNEDQDGDVQFGSENSSYSPKLIIADH